MDPVPTPENVPRRCAAVSDGRTAGRAPRSGRWCTQCSRTADPHAPDLRRRIGCTGPRPVAALARRRDTRCAGHGDAAAAHHTARPARAWADPRRPRPRRPAPRTRLRDPTGRRRSRRSAADVRLAEVAPLLRTHLPADDPLLAYADRLEQPLLGRQSLRGYLSGSIDVVLRVPGTPPIRRRRLQDQPARRPRAAGSPSADYGPRPAGRRNAALRLPVAGDALLGRRCTATCAGGCPATTRRRTSAASSTSTCAACAARRRPLIDGHPAGVFSWPLPAGAGARAVRPARWAGTA